VIKEGRVGRITSFSQLFQGLTEGADSVFIESTIDEKLNYSNLLVPTMDSTRALYVIKHNHKQKIPTLVVGAEGITIEE